MSRYPTAQLQPAQPTLEGDETFVGLNMKLDRDKLGPGFLARAENNRLNRGVIAPRLGTITPKFANVVPLAMTGSGLYSNPNAGEVILVANGDEVLVIAPGSYPGSVGLPADFISANPACEFSQHFDKVLLHRHDGGKTLEWDGFTAAFVPLAKFDPLDTSTDIMPDPPWSVNFADRAIFPIPGEPDTLGVSDINDPTSYDPLLNKYRINRGTADAIVGAYPFPTNSLVIGKNHGIDVLTNFVGDLSRAAMEVISTEIGMCGRRATKMVGADLFFLSKDHRAIFRISQVIQDRLQAEPVPVSDAIEPVMKRVNWSAAENAVGAVHDIYYILFLPLDGSLVNNAAVAYNTVTQQWEGAPDTWAEGANMQIDNLIHSYYFGDAALYGFNYSANQIYIFGIDTGDDKIGDDRFEIRHLIESRGYATLGWNASTRRDFKQLKMAVATLRASITVTQLMDGAKDERLLTPTPIQRSRARYRNFGRADFDPSNVNDDFSAPGREDYSQVFDNDFYLQDGVELGIKQREVLPFSTKARGRYASVRVENSQGECEIGGFLTDSTGTQRNQSRRAA